MSDMSDSLKNTPSREQSDTPLDPDVIAELERQLNVIGRGIAEIVPAEELRAKLVQSLTLHKPLRIKLGVDPTTTDIHLGHTVVLEKLRDFQELGHQVIFLIGDFTAQIGDPSGRSETRKPLTKEEVAKNSKTYYDQVLKILVPSKTQIVFNSQWCEQLKIQDVIKLCAQMTVARMLERDDFEKRHGSGQSISIHEFLYPIMQAYDSVQLRADVEIGGTDQKFNCLLGRDYQRAAGQDPQVVITMPILEGTDGVQKMSKSLGNYIGITDPPKELFGKVMSISDKLMYRFYELLTRENLKEIKEIHPKEAKVQLAKKLVERFHSSDAAEEAAAEFETVFSKKQLPTDIPVSVIKGKQISLTKVMAEEALVTSLSEARRLIVQGGVTVDGQKIEDTAHVIEGPEERLLKVGKRKFLRLQFQPGK